LQQRANAEEVTLPAGTLLSCTLDEPNFSSASAQVGDPVICHTRGVQQFGRVVFPRGAYLAGRLAAEKDPGHFLGKGWLKLEFDHISLPDAAVPVPGKIVAVRGYRVDKEGKVIGHCMRRHRHQEFIRFLNAIEAEVPAGKIVHVILDSYATHKHPKVRAWLARHPRFVFHSTPTSCSWLNAVETFFAKLTKRRLKRGVFCSFVDL